MKQIKSKGDLQPDRRNANQSTTRGQAAVAESLSRYGAGRSILVDKNGKIIAGNTTESNWDGEIVVVPSDGSRLVVVQRTDLDLDSDPAARELAHADNRSNQLGYNPDVSKIEEDILGGAELEWLWRADELEAMKGLVEPEGDTVQDFEKVPRNSSGYEVIVIFPTEEEAREGRKKIQDLGFYTK